MKNIDHYDLVDNYTMKCRLYPNKECAEKIDNSIYAVQCFHNCLLYDIFNGNIELVEKEYKPKKESKPKQHKDESDADYEARCYSYIEKQKYHEGDLIHFIDTKKSFSAEYKKKLTEEHPVIDNAPAGAITSNVGVKDDILKSLGKLPVEFQKPKYYSKAKKRTIYTYQETFSKVSISEDNDNVIYFNLAKIGTVKLRGWNKNIRFGENAELNFIEYCKENSKNKVTITVKKDNCGDYWICFKLSNVYVPARKETDKQVGIDVGVKDVIICSDGTKYENKYFKKKEKKHLKYLQRRLARRQGWANEEFRAIKDEDKVPSKTYERTRLKLAKLERCIATKRNDYNNKITRSLIDKSNYIGVESLNISGMFRNRHLASALADASMFSILNMIKYKAEWHNKIVQPIDTWSPSSKRCNCCGYILDKLSLSTREWDCPNCNAHLDRDINAAKNILNYSLEIYNN